ncbi:MAG: GntR family transcriptional regulator [Pseudomonadota bacterium]
MNAIRKSNCIEDLRTRILTLDLSPGSALEEPVLCERYGMSRTPMREILQRLYGEGYVELSQNRGAKVASMDLLVMRTFFRTAPMIYSAISRLAAENRRVQDLVLLREVQGAFRKATETGAVAESAMLNHRFHLSIGHMARNPYLLPSLERMLIDHTRLSQTFYNPGSEDERERVARAVEQHDTMIAAIEAQDGEAATQLSIDHWALSRDRLEQFVRPDPLPLDMLVEQGDRYAV